jgi:ribonuclease E
MLEEQDTTPSESSTTPEAAAETEQEPAAGGRRQRPRRAASRPAGPPPPLANPFLGGAEEPAEPSTELAAAPPVPETVRPAAMAVFQTPQLPVPQPAAESAAGEDSDSDGDGATEQRQPRRRNRNRRNRSQEPAEGEQSPGAADRAGEQEPQAESKEGAAESAPAEEAPAQPASTKKRRRRKRGSGGDNAGGSDDANTVTKVRSPKESEPEKVTGVKGSTRLEAKKQRRREGREAGRRRAPILSEAEFLARREAVDRAMVVRQLDDITQIAVLEDNVLVEHYVTKDSGAPATMVGNVYLGRVQNVLPSMEAAFVDIGRGRNAVLYAGEVNWDAAGLDGQPKRIEFALKSGDPVLVQVTKDPIGHKGARLTSQVSLPGRYLVFVPDGSMTGISRKLPDTERSRLRGILKRIVPDDVGVIVRTAAEGASEEELQRDVTRLAKSWEEIKRKAGSASPPQLLHAEPDLAIRVVRDLFNEDFGSLQVSGDRVWRQIREYVDGVAPDLSERLSKWTGSDDLFAHHRIDEQLAKALDRKVWLPSGGSLIIEHTEAMTVIDVNTGKFTGQGGDLEETVTQNNLEAAEEIVRQVRLRDIGGIIVIDFIDMVLESNRDLVLRRLVECLGRDRTKHQVTEVTSLGLAQMTRKRIGGGLLETFSESCDACNGRGVRIHFDPIGAPANGRRKPVKPAGAHDPIETMNRAAAEDEADTPATEAAAAAAGASAGDAATGPDAEPGDAVASAASDAAPGAAEGEAEEAPAEEAPAAAVEEPAVVEVEPATAAPPAGTESSDASAAASSVASEAGTVLTAAVAGEAAAEQLPVPQPEPSVEEGAAAAGSSAEPRESPEGSGPDAAGRPNGEPV